MCRSNASQERSESSPVRESPVGGAPSTTAACPDVGAHAIGHLGSHLRLWIVAAVGLVVDLWSKTWAFDSLGQGGRRVLIPRVLELQTMMNDGALFGIGSGQTTLFLIASVLALGLVVWMFACSSPRNWLLHVAFGAILAGAAGNMYDRVFVKVVAVRSPGGVLRFFEKSASPDGQQIELWEYPARAGDEPLVQPASEAIHMPEATGHVRDFIKIPTRFFGGRELWPWVFNVADMLLVGGVGILAIRLWRDRSRPARGESALDSPAPEA